MIVKRNNSWIFLFLALCSASVWGQTPLSYSSFIDNVTGNHPLYKKAQNTITIGNYQYKAAQGNFDPQINALTENKFYNGKNYFNNLDIELKQSLYSGQTLKAGFDQGIGPYLNPENLTPGNGMAFLGMEVSLLQGMLIDKKRAEVLKARQYKTLAGIESTINSNELLWQAANAYAGWIKDYSIAELNQKYTQTSYQRLLALKDLSAIGERPALDTIEAAILYQYRELDLYNALISLNKSYFSLNSFLWENDSNNTNSLLLPSVSINQLTDQFLSSFLKSENFVLATDNPYINQYKVKGQLLSIEKRLRKEMVKPQLNLKYNLLQYGNSNSLNLNNYKWGATFAMPLLLRSSVNELKINSLQSQNNLLELKNKMAEIQNKSRALVSNLNDLSKQINIAKTNVVYSRKLLDAEILKFENNESSLFLLNTRETKLLESEIKLSEIQHKFIQSYLNLIYLQGNLNYQLN